MTPFPKGVRAKEASLMCWVAKGIPIIVIAHKMAKIIWVIEIQIPPMRIQIIFIKVGRHPVEDSLLTTFLPKGMSPRRAILKH